MNVLVIGFLYYQQYLHRSPDLSLAIWKEFARADPPKRLHIKRPPEPQFRGTGIPVRSRQDILRLREADGAHATVPPGVLLFWFEAVVRYQASPGPVAREAARDGHGDHLAQREERT